MENKMEVIGNVKVAGVYCIRRKDNADILYVGSSIEVNDALSRHLYYLKRGKYADTNKNVLQEQYDLRNLQFTILWESVYSRKDIVNMNIEQKEALQEELGTLEQFYINMYKNTVCNKQKSVTKHSSNRNRYSYYKRHNSNRGTNNPSCKYNEKVIKYVIYLKENGYKAKDIVKLIKDNEGVDLKSSYIPQVGVYKWINTQAVKPSWIA